MAKKIGIYFGEELICLVPPHPVELETAATSTNMDKPFVFEGLYKGGVQGEKHVELEYYMRRGNVYYFRTKDRKKKLAITGKTDDSGFELKDLKRGWYFVNFEIKQS